MEPWRAHIPVLAAEVIQWISLKPGLIYVDATLGLGGHSELILQNPVHVGRVVGFEWDPDAAAIARERLAPYGDRFTLVPTSYTQLTRELTRLGIHNVAGIVADFGVSSLQLDRVERGFSFQSDAPLDMRMSSSINVTAADMVADLSEEQLADVFYHYGEERQARRIARRLVQYRDINPVKTTCQLADIVAAAVPRKFHPKKIHVATKVFQALRIAVNREFENITSLIQQAPEVLAEKGRICTISFHSLEDRMVKHLFQKEKYTVLTRKPVQAEAAEVAVNPRARSARLRVAEKK
ncbi:16S rRNA (cytosine(1402)-N(4))-methyltransferase RsmH [Desulfogranum japonicum]|uniref:16S rRNA (cytosine(1402)-N(4))-methyltransferase RsmH n=1 Tax=Desulfogranum japonicum TaxID=231447 RepID=UPI00042200DB|nr:16S rRNA (cytosine(1402)-N(4))-methyltransferase RsmH [Desulfogranum japonicum]